MDQKDISRTTSVLSDVYRDNHTAIAGLAGRYYKTINLDRIPIENIKLMSALDSSVMALDAFIAYSRGLQTLA